MAKSVVKSGTIAGLAGLVALGLPLSGCGDGGGVNSTPPPVPTPTPTPTPVADTSLIGMTGSHTFTNDATTGTETAALSNGVPVKASAKAGTVTFAYDNASKSYTVTAGADSATFAPGDRSAAHSTATFDVYEKTSGKIAQSLTLSKPGASGTYATQYVGSGFYEHIDTSGPTNGIGNLSAFTYGFATGASAVPTTGHAEYAVTLAGAIAGDTNATGGVAGISGTGTLQVDFADGKYVVGASGGINDGTGANFSFQSAGALTSGGNALHGQATTLLYSASVTTLLGGLDGRFYGPTAQEAGAAFYGSGVAPSGFDMAIAGTLTGKGAAVTPPTQDLTSLASSDWLTGLSATWTFHNSSPTTLPEALTTDSHSISNAIVNLAADATTGNNPGVTLFTGNGAYTPGGNSGPVNTNGNLDPPGFAPRAYSYSHLPAAAEGLTGGGLKYVFAGHIYLPEFDATSHSTLDPYKFTYEDYVAGYATAASAIPKTGTASFNITLNGESGAANSSLITLVSGNGLLSADFGAGSINLTGNVLGSSATPFSGSGQITSGANAFSGTLQTALGGSYSGPFSGKFFGPALDETGGVFSLADAAGDVISGVFDGANRAAAGASVPGLEQLTKVTSLPVAGFTEYNAILNSPNLNETAMQGSVDYDPATKTYTFNAQPQAGLLGVYAVQAVLDPTKVTAAASDASFTTYSASDASGPLKAKLFNVGATNPTLALTYTSFAEIKRPSSDLGGGASTSETYYMVFGVQTPVAQIPVSGTATFNGIAYGRAYGYYPAPFASGQFTTKDGSSMVVNGTSSVAVDFGAATATASLTLAGTDPTTSATNPLGQFTFAGSIASAYSGAGSSSGTFSLGSTGTTATEGALQAQFFGTGAAEIGGTFRLVPYYGAIGATPAFQSIQGVIVGKR